MFFPDFYQQYQWVFFFLERLQLMHRIHVHQNQTILWLMEPLVCFYLRPEASVLSGSLGTSLSALGCTCPSEPSRASRPPALAVGGAVGSGIVRSFCFPLLEGMDLALACQIQTLTSSRELFPSTPPWAGYLQTCHDLLVILPRGSIHQ